MPRFTYLLSPCSCGSSIPKPTDLPLALAAPHAAHAAGPPAGDNRHAALGDLAANGACRLVERIGLGRAGTAEDGHCRTKLGKCAKTINELCLNAQHAPGVGVQPVGRVLGRQQVGVGVVLGNHGAAHDHGAAAVRLVVGRLALDVLILNHGYSYREKEKRAGSTPCVKHPPEHQLFGMVPTMHQVLASYRSSVAQTVLANVMTGRRSSLAVPTLCKRVCRS